MSEQRCRLQQENMNIYTVGGCYMYSHGPKYEHLYSRGLLHVQPRPKISHLTDNRAITRCGHKHVFRDIDTNNTEN
jgi:hypothetical protein